MTAPDRPHQPRTRRLLPWLLLALLLATGVVLYFMYGSQVAPLTDGMR
jgi:hypothetical protein